MKRLLLSIVLGGAAAWPAMGQPSYETKTASGTTTALVYFATSPLQQIRVVGAIASSDLVGANIQIRSGTTPVTCAYTNAAGNQFGVSRTNGFFVGDLVLLETAGGVMTNGIITAFTAATNIICAGLTMPATVPGDTLYRLGSPTTLWCGVYTNRNIQGEALHVGARGRPVMVIVPGTSACSLDSVTARYE